MLSQLRRGWLRLAIVTAAAAAVAPGVAAQPRQAPVESVIYDLKNPDPVRRQAAARDLGAAKYKAATPQLAAMARDVDASVRREVELALERMEDIQALPGFIAFASDVENDIRSRAVVATPAVEGTRAVPQSSPPAQNSVTGPTEQVEPTGDVVEEPEPSERPEAGALVEGNAPRGARCHNMNSRDGMQPCPTSESLD